MAELHLMKSSTIPTLPITHCCPACGLLCDDLVLTATLPMNIKNACAKSVSFYNNAWQENLSVPLLAGKASDLNTTIQAAADILRASNQPLFSGLGTEVQGMRAMVGLAKKTNATLDHMHSEGTVRNTLAMQNSGWQTTTLTEIKNRADIILAIGTDIVTSHPRFFEKLVWNASSLFDKPSPEIIYLAVPKNTLEDNLKAGISPTGKMPTIITADTSKLPEIISTLNALMNGKKITVDQVAGVAIATLLEVLDKLKTAKYAVITWSASNFQYTHAELTVQSITHLIAKLNESTRVAGLPLNSGDGDSTVNNVSTWLSGYPTRSRHFEGQTAYDAYYFSSTQQLKKCDALLWVSTFNAHLPPHCDAPTIVIGHANMQFDKAPDVFIPVGIPGVDHAGSIFRMDSSVAMPLKKLRENQLPSLSEVIHQIEALLT